MGWPDGAIAPRHALRHSDQRWLLRPYRRGTCQSVCGRSMAPRIQLIEVTMRITKPGALALYQATKSLQGSSFGFALLR